MLQMEKMMRKKIVLLMFTFFAGMGIADAHSLWINTFESHSHTPGHAMVTLGWGHNLPLDDILNAPGRRMELEHFFLMDESLKQTDLITPTLESRGPVLTTDNFDLFEAQLGARKIALKENSAPGVYQLSAVSRPKCFTKYIDTKGRKRMKLKSMDQLDQIQEVLTCMQYQAFAKSYLTIGPWKQPKKLGHALEIIPLTDLSRVRVGDLVEVQVLSYNKPLNLTPGSMEFITAQSSSFGQSDGFFLMSYIQQGHAQFRVQSQGQWIITVKHFEKVTPEGTLKNLEGKVQQVFHCATLTFSVK